MTRESSSLKQTTHAQRAGRAVARPNSNKWKPAFRVLHRNLLFQCNILPIDSDAATQQTVPVRRNRNRNPYRTRSATQLPNRETDVSMSDSSDTEDDIVVALDTESVPDVLSDSIADENNESANIDSGRLADQRVREIELQSYVKPERKIEHVLPETQESIRPIRNRQYSQK